MENQDMMRKSTEVLLDIISDTSVTTENVQEVYTWIKEEIAKNEDLYIFYTFGKSKDDVKSNLLLLFIFERMFNIWLEYDKHGETFTMSKRLSYQIGDVNFEEKLIRDLLGKYNNIQKINDELSILDEKQLNQKSRLEEIEKEFDDNRRFYDKLNNGINSCKKNIKMCQELKELKYENIEIYDQKIEEANKLIEQYKKLVEENQERLNIYKGIIDDEKMKVKSLEETRLLFQTIKNKIKNENI